MKNFGQWALGSTTKKLVHWYGYMDDTFVVWPHGKELHVFLYTRLNKSLQRYQINLLHKTIFNLFTIQRFTYDNKNPIFIAYWEHKYNKASFLLKY